jgi:D-glycero-D-manno-heptose 1,7-bisphosphate phosphatase
MLRQAACDLGLDLGASWLVGDAVRDLEAAAAVGARGILVLTGRGAEQLPRLSPEMRARWPVVADLPAAIAMILAAKNL